MRELHLEGQRVVEPASLFLQGVLEVANVLAIAVPPCSILAGVRLLLGIDERLHALVIRTFRLNQVDEIELVCYSFFHVIDLEVIPLGIDSGVVVIL